jgi:hypothetical protein
MSALAAPAAVTAAGVGVGVGGGGISNGNLLLSSPSGGAGGGAHSSAHPGTHLLSHGWSSRQVPMLRFLYGSNGMTDNERGPGASSMGNARCGSAISVASTILSALASQLKEPLILMLLGSAAISLVLGNSADAASIGVALLIVSLVAAIQEYRSEAALEKLANLVPHTCTVLRDGQVRDGCLAKDLVVGDLVLLATGEYVVPEERAGSCLRYDCECVKAVAGRVPFTSLTVCLLRLAFPCLAFALSLWGIATAEFPPTAASSTRSSSRWTSRP